MAAAVLTPAAELRREPAEGGRRGRTGAGGRSSEAAGTAAETGHTTGQLRQELSVPTEPEPEP